jgi:Tol biopolymer transport system component
MTRTVRIELGAVLAVVLALLSYSRIREHRESPPVEERTAGVTGEVSGDETAIGAVETTEGDPVVSAGHPNSGASRGRQGSSDAKGSRSTGGLPEGTIPQGFEIAFTRCCEGQQNTSIYLMNEDGSDNRMLRAGVEPGWSPDGKIIAFTDVNRARGLALMNADGSGLQNLPLRGFSPTWSPDGGQLAFAWDCHNHQSGEACSAEGFWPTDPVQDCGPECGIGVVARDGTGVRHLGDGIWPDWGPDGRIMFADGVPTGSCYYDGGTGWGMTEKQCELPIWVMNHDGSGRTRFPIDKAIRPTWSSDGRKIAYSTAAGDIFIANSDGHGVVKVASGGAYWSQPSWSPDSLWLALRGSTPSGYSSIYLRRIDGSAERRLTSRGGVSDYVPAFSPRR